MFCQRAGGRSHKKDFTYHTKKQGFAKTKCSVNLLVSMLLKLRVFSIVIVRYCGFELNRLHHIKCRILRCIMFARKLIKCNAYQLILIQRLRIRHFSSLIFSLYQTPGEAKSAVAFHMIATTSFRDNYVTLWTGPPAIVITKFIEFQRFKCGNGCKFVCDTFMRY